MLKHGTRPKSLDIGQRFFGKAPVARKKQETQRSEKHGGETKPQYGKLHGHLDNEVAERCQNVGRNDSPSAKPSVARAPKTVHGRLRLRRAHGINLASGEVGKARFPLGFPVPTLTLTRRETSFRVFELSARFVRQDPRASRQFSASPLVASISARTRLSGFQNDRPVGSQKPFFF